jgi:thioredoxin-like negative regulator of GroEL
MPTSTRRTPPQAPPSELSSPMDELHRAIGDLDHVRQSVHGDAQVQLDHATARLCAVASDLHERAEEEIRQLESELEHAGEALRVELAARAIRAQRTTAALTRLAAEIRRRRVEIVMGD